MHAGARLRAGGTAVALVLSAKALNHAAAICDLPGVYGYRQILRCSWVGCGDEVLEQGRGRERACELRGDEPGRVHRGEFPKNVLVSDRASVTAGLANDVDAVNQ